MREFHVLVGEMQVHHLTYCVQAPSAEAAKAYVAGDDSAAWITDDTRDPVLVEDRHYSTINVEDMGVVEPFASAQDAKDCEDEHVEPLPSL